MNTIPRAFEVAESYRAGKRPSTSDLAIVFEALDALYAELSKAQQRRLRPRIGRKRGRPRKWKYHEWWIGRLLDSALRDGMTWRNAVAAMHRELEPDGVDLPYGDDTLRNYLKRYRDGDARPRLRLPKK
jgi:hypothetical protein